MDVRTFLSSLTGLETFLNREPSHKWLGYFQNVLWDMAVGARGKAAVNRPQSRRCARFGFG